MKPNWFPQLAPTVRQQENLLYIFRDNENQLFGRIMMQFCNLYGQTLFLK